TARLPAGAGGADFDRAAGEVGEESAAIWERPALWTQTNNTLGWLIGLREGWYCRRPRIRNFLSQRGGARSPFELEGFAVRGIKRISGASLTRLELLTAVSARK